jgi:integrase
LPLAAIGRPQIDEWDSRIASAVGASRRRNFHVVVRTVFRSAVAAGYVPTLPEFAPLPKVPRTVVEAADPADVAALITESDRGVATYFAKTRRAARLAFALAAYAGLRASEVRALRWIDVDLRAGTITVRFARVHGEIDTPKSGHQRELPIAPALLSMLNAASVGKKPAHLVAPRADGKPWGDSGIIQALRRAANRLGIEGRRYHALRHHFVTVLFVGGAPAPVVQALAGHASLTVTQRYAHHSREQKRVAVQVFFKLGNNRVTAREKKQHVSSKLLSHPGDLNPRPTVYETVALPLS